MLKFILLGSFVIFAIFLGSYLATYHKLDATVIQNEIARLGIWSSVGFFALATLLVFFLLPGMLVSISAGAIFPFWLAVLLVFASQVTGSTLAFLFARYLGRDFVKTLLDTRFSKLKIYDDGLEKNGFKFVLLLRLIPLFPFNGLNIGLALTKVRFRDYFLATILGILPVSMIYIYLGSSVASGSPAKILLTVSVLAVLSMVGYSYRKRSRKQEAAS